MTHKEILALFDFDRWATERTLEVVSTLSDEQYARDLGTSHGNIHGTLFHAYAADRFWFDRMRGMSRAFLSNPEEIPTFPALRSAWDSWRKEMEEYLSTLSDTAVQQVFSYQDTKGKVQSFPVYQILQHLVNHSTYHRGQVVSMLRQLGAKPVNTDLVHYYRSVR